MEKKPNQSAGKGALDAFLNLLNLITLGWVSLALGGLLFKIIDKFFNPEIFSDFSQVGIKSGIAAVIIILPTFLAVAGYLHKHYKSGKLNPDSGIYRWLTYLMLLIAALVIVGSLVAIIFKFLNGDYTAATILKILVLLIIAGGIFGYYWYDLKRKDYSQKSPISIGFFTALVVVCLLAVIIGAFIIDAPAVTRMKRQDQERVNHMNQISAMIISYFIEKDELPVDLSAPRFSTIKDPETKQPYDYNLINENEYELCATFAQPAEQNGMTFVGGADWNYHGVGYQCFPITVNPELLKSLQAQIQNQLQGQLQDRVQLK